MNFKKIVHNAINHKYKSVPQVISVCNYHIGDNNKTININYKNTHEGCDIQSSTWVGTNACIRRNEQIPIEAGLLWYQVSTGSNKMPYVSSMWSNISPTK